MPGISTLFKVISYFVKNKTARDMVIKTAKNPTARNIVIKTAKHMMKNDRRLLIGIIFLLEFKIKIDR